MNIWGLRWFFLLESTHKLLFKLFSQERHFCKTRHFVQPSVSLVKRECSLHIFKHNFTLCKNFAIEAVLEQGIETVHMLIGETKSIQLM